MRHKRRLNWRWLPKAPQPTPCTRLMFYGRILRRSSAPWPTFEALVADVLSNQPPPEISRKFHNGLVTAFVAIAETLRIALPQPRMLERRNLQQSLSDYSPCCCAHHREIRGIHRKRGSCRGRRSQLGTGDGGRAPKPKLSGELAGEGARPTRKLRCIHLEFLSCVVDFSICLGHNPRSSAVIRTHPDNT